jgi:hypothetical protein
MLIEGMHSGIFRFILQEEFVEIFFFYRRRFIQNLEMPYKTRSSWMLIMCMHSGISRFVEEDFVENLKILYRVLALSQMLVECM